MNQDKLKLITLLPGLLAVRDTIDKQIKDIEAQFEPPKDDSLGARISTYQKRAWANYTPEQRAARVLAAKQGRRKQLRAQKGK